MKEVTFRIVPVEPLSVTNYSGGKIFRYKYHLDRAERFTIQVPSFSEQPYHPARFITAGMVVSFFALIVIVAVFFPPKPPEGGDWIAIILFTLAAVFIPIIVYRKTPVENWEMAATFLREKKRHAGFLSILCLDMKIEFERMSNGYIFLKEEKWKEVIQELKGDRSDS